MTEPQENIQDEQDQIRQRREKLTALREETIAFPTDFRRDVVVGENQLENMVKKLKKNSKPNICV